MSLKDQIVNYCMMIEERYSHVSHRIMKQYMKLSLILLTESHVKNCRNFLRNGDWLETAG